MIFSWPRESYSYWTGDGTVHTCTTCCHFSFFIPSLLPLFYDSNCSILVFLLGDHRRITSVVWSMARKPTFDFKLVVLVYQEHLSTTRVEHQSKPYRCDTGSSTALVLNLPQNPVLVSASSSLNFSFYWLIQGLCCFVLKVAWKCLGLYSKGLYISFSKVSLSNVAHTDSDMVLYACAVRKSIS